MDSTRYELLDVIGTGGMATVWRARDLRLDRVVALKRPGTDTDPRRFEREGRLAAGVVHPNVVRVYDVGSDEQGPYLVMELVDGPSVAEADVDRHRAGDLGAEIASALAALHLAGIVHGDVKPANILLSDGVAHLTDFGVARRGDDVTTGPVWATPSYAAPEVVSGATPSAASDVYSLAIVLHEIVTGVSWSTPAATQPLPSGDWAGILGPALATDPADRPDAASFARSLERMAPGGTALPPTVPTTTQDGRMPLSAPPAPLVPRRSMSTTTRQTDPRRRGRSHALVGSALIGILALVVGVAAVAARSDDQVSSTRGSSAPEATGVPNATQAAPAVPVATTGAVSTTAAPTTIVATPPAAPPRPPIDVIAGDLAALIESQPSSDLKPKDARSMLDDLDEVVRRATEGRDARKALDELAERAARHLPAEVRDQAENLIIALAEQVGVDMDDLEERFEDDGDGDDGDD